MIKFTKCNIERLIVFLCGIIIGITFCVFTLFTTNNAVVIPVRVSNIYRENTNLVYRKLFDLNEQLKKNYKKNRKYEWCDTLGAINDYLSIPDNYSRWNTYVIDSNKYELLIVRSYERPCYYYLLTNDGIYDMKFIPVTIKIDTVLR